MDAVASYYDVGEQNDRTLRIHYLGAHLVREVTGHEQASNTRPHEEARGSLRDRGDDGAVGDIASGPRRSRFRRKRIDVLQTAAPSKRLLLEGQEVDFMPADGIIAIELQVRKLRRTNRRLRNRIPDCGSDDDVDSAGCVVKDRPRSFTFHRSNRDKRGVGAGEEDASRLLYGGVSPGQDVDVSGDAPVHRVIVLKPEAVGDPRTVDRVDSSRRRAPYDVDFTALAVLSVQVDVSGRSEGRRRRAFRQTGSRTEDRSDEYEEAAHFHPGQKPHQT
jgi:hypothetical protein